MDRTLQYDVSQLPDPPPEYPATVAYVRRKVASVVGEAQSAAESAAAEIPALREAVSEARSTADAAKAQADAAKAQADADAADVSKAKSDSAYAVALVDAHSAEVSKATADATAAKTVAESAQSAAREAGDLSYKAGEDAKAAITSANEAKSVAESAQSAAEAAQASVEELASGLPAKADLVGGKVPVDQLPSYVSDVYEYDSVSAFPASGDGGRIYVARDTNLTYRWGGTAYVEISPSLALGETADTAYAGSEGKALRTDFDSAYAEFGGHRDSRANPHGVTAGQVGAYTKDEVDLEFARVDADLSSCARKTDIPTRVSALANDALYVTEAQVTPSPTNAGHALSADFADGAGVAGSIFWSNVLGTPDTLAGYGITDAASGSALDDLDTRCTVVAERVTSLESMDMTINDRVDDLDTRCTVVAERVSSLESMDVTISDRVDDLDTRCTVVAERVSSLESMDVTISDRVASLEVTVGAANASLESVA